MIVKYFDDGEGFIEKLTVGIIKPLEGPPRDQWMPTQYQLDKHRGPLMSITFKARRGKSPQGQLLVKDSS